MESNIRIPHVAKGTKAEECIMRAIKSKEEDGKRKVVFGQIFENIGELELEDASSFNYFLYVCINKLFSNETWCNYTPDEKHILKLFNSAYNISTRANTATVPRLYYNRYFEMVEKWEFNSEEREHQRNIEEIRTIFSMVHAILDREPEKSKQMEDFLGYLESEDEYPSYLKYFQPLNKDLKADEPEVGVENAQTTLSNEEDEMETSSIKKERAKAAIKMLLEYSDSDYSLAKNKSLWWAVFRFFAEREFCPNNMAAFCRLMNEWGFQVSVSNLKGPNSKMERLNEVRTQNWKELVDTSTGAELKQIKVGMKLIEILRRLPKP